MLLTYNLRLSGVILLRQILRVLMFYKPLHEAQESVLQQDLSFTMSIWTMKRSCLYLQKVACRIMCTSQGLIFMIMNTVTTEAKIFTAGYPII